ncbi:tumor necrosis factor receptor superfamily member 13B isoform X2 [Cynoglossus semilaevis]|uniref:tumor necrosis factor receptor superfamily member 13B isoform X2 n=1 Tax=Cynoglossus semilaevis TaxID=244447 RepID=UPI000D62E088|nr:tumor necrosis factor receptor superfamily member 13B isoform X2 [Cynoglossus semilaevis]
MGGRCPEGQFKDSLLRKCAHCNLICQQKPVVNKCSSFCESAQCRQRPGHYYDGLLKKCVKCAEVCGRHPAQCSDHCVTPGPATSPLLTSKPLRVTSHLPTSSDLSTPVLAESPTLLLYSLLALSLLLLFSSLSIALTVILRRYRTKASHLAVKTVKQNHRRHKQHGEEVGRSPGKAIQTSRDTAAASDLYADSEPLSESSPTETCVCVHCFPDLKALGQGHDRPPRTQSSLYEKNKPLWRNESLHTSENQDLGGGDGTEMNSICSLKNISVFHKEWKA